MTDFYTELQWVRMLAGAIHITRQPMTSIFDLLTVAGTGKKKILIEGNLISTLRWILANFLCY